MWRYVRESFVADDLPEIQFDLSSVASSVKAEDEPPPPSRGRWTFLEIAFDLSFLDQREAVDVEQAEVSNLQMRNDRQRQERDLQEWFRQRTAELRRAAQRSEASPPRPLRMGRGSSDRPRRQR